MVLVAASQDALGDKALRRPDTTMTTAEIPVWVNSRQRWVTGVNRKTTCDDVIAVLLKSEGARGGGGGGGGSGDGGNGAGCGSGGGGAGPSTVVGDGHGYAIMERWRRVERPLDGRARILKVWHAWGDAQGEVRLTLRRVDHSEADSGRGSPSRDPPGAGAGAGPAAPPAHQRRRRHHHRSQHHHHHHHRHRERERGDAKPPWPGHETLHPRRLAQLQGAAGGGGGGSSKLPETIERLMKLILQQGETIQSQLRKLQEREHQIEHLEDETHRARVEALGSNYLLETYLGSQLDAEEDEEEKGNDSGVVTEGGSEPASGSSPSSGHDDEAPRCLGARPRVDDDDEANFADESDEGTRERTAAEDGALLDLKTQVDLWEKLVKVNKRLEREEESLVRLHIKFRRLQSERPPAGEGAEDGGGGGGAASALRVLPEEELDPDECQARDALLAELERVRAQLEQGSREMEQTAHALAEAEALLDARRRYLRRLQAELDASDRETDRLQGQIAAAVAAAANAPVPAPTTPLAHPPPAAIHSAAPAKAKTDAPISSANMNDTDSNSDTGLSSLHSGSEEGVYILDTLV